MPILSWRAVIPAGGRRTVPCLVTPEGAQADSTDILRWVDRRGHAPALFPEAADAAGDGARSRRTSTASWALPRAAWRISTCSTIRDLLRSLLVSAGAGWEARLGGALFPLLRSMIVRGLGVNPAGAARSRQVVDETFARVEARLADGRPYLCGDRFTAADLTFAALATPLLLPEPSPPSSPWAREPPAPSGTCRRHRARPAGRFALRLYEKDRAPLPEINWTTCIPALRRRPPAAAPRCLRCAGWSRSVTSCPCGRGARCPRWSRPTTSRCTWSSSAAPARGPRRWSPSCSWDSSRARPACACPSWC